ncbi:MAG: YbgA family protein [Desulfobulbaceae bacterium]
MDEKIRLGISSCLLGNSVRYNGGHQIDLFLVETLGPFVEFVPVCPEVECGLGIPRESMRLVGTMDNPRLLTSKSGIDHTDRMKEWAGRKVRELEGENLSGFIFKSKSPSSGMERVRVYRPDKTGYVGTRPGMFAEALMNHLPLLPVEEDGRLHDISLRENFIEQIFVYRRWRNMVADNFTTGDLVAFHTDHKLQIMAHSITHYRTMGALVAQAKKYPRSELVRNYENSLMKALRLKATVQKNTNVLQHMMGYFKNLLNGEEKQELLDLIENYRKGYYPLIVPITMINHYVRKYREKYLARQHYLNPHPTELKLRNHA